MTQARGPWKLLDLLQEASGFLGSKGVESARLETEMMLAAALGVRRLDLYLQFDKVLSDDEVQTFRGHVRERLAGRPVQYITGDAGFRLLDLHVDERVLVPRPETEILVDQVLAFLPTAPAGAIVDIGCGSGAIVLALATEGPRRGVEPGATHVDDGADDDEAPVAGAGDDADPSAAPRGERRIVYFEDDEAGELDEGDDEVGEDGPDDGSDGGSADAGPAATEAPLPGPLWAVDVSSEALAVARDNARHCGAADRVVFLRADLLTAFAPGEGFAVIVSNPPYIASGDLAGLQPEVRDHEPHLALDGGDDGLDAIRRLVAAAPALLVPGGRLFLEVGAGQADAVAELLAAAGLQELHIQPDLAGIPRVVSGCRPALAAARD